MHTALLLALVAGTAYAMSVALRPTPARERLTRFAPQVAVLATLAFVVAQAAGLGVVGSIVTAAAITGADLHPGALRRLFAEQRADSNRAARTMARPTTARPHARVR